MALSYRKKNGTVDIAADDAVTQLIRLATPGSQSPPTHRVRNKRPALPPGPAARVSFPRVSFQCRGPRIPIDEALSQVCNDGVSHKTPHRNLFFVSSERLMSI
jgi:hypothetical protein